MKNPVRDNSLHAYRTIHDILPRCEIVVYNAIMRMGRPTSREVAEYLEKSDGWVSARVRSLKDKGHIIEAGNKTRTIDVGGKIRNVSAAMLKAVEIPAEIRISSDGDGQLSFA